jgi:hypothetical protein
MARRRDQNLNGTRSLSLRVTRTSDVAGPEPGRRRSVTVGTYRTRRSLPGRSINVPEGPIHRDSPSLSESAVVAVNHDLSQMLVTNISSLRDAVATALRWTVRLCSRAVTAAATVTAAAARTWPSSGPSPPTRKRADQLVDAGPQAPLLVRARAAKCAAASPSRLTRLTGATARQRGRATYTWGQAGLSGLCQWAEHGFSSAH